MLDMLLVVCSGFVLWCDCEWVKEVGFDVYCVKLLMLYWLLGYFELVSGGVMKLDGDVI